METGGLIFDDLTARFVLCSYHFTNPRAAGSADEAAEYAGYLAEVDAVPPSVGFRDEYSSLAGVPEPTNRLAAIRASKIVG